MSSNAQLNGATAKFAVSGIKPDEVAVETQKVAAVAQGNSAYASTPTVQAMVIAWIATANTVGDLAKAVAVARLALAAAILALAKAMSPWKRATTNVVAAVNNVAAGYPDVIKAWGFAVATHVLLPASNAAPLNLRVSFRKELPPLIRWSPVNGDVGYVLQIGDGTPAGWGASISCPNARYAPLNLVTGQKVALRVAVIRKSGQSEWSDVVNTTIR